MPRGLARYSEELEQGVMASDLRFAGEEMLMETRLKRPCQECVERGKALFYR
jgi:hypothetical protein